MDPFLARTMVETLSKGINPATGRALPISDSCSNEDIQDALIEVLEHCTIESTEQYACRIREENREKRKERMEKVAERYPRARAPWDGEEEERMLAMHRSGKNIYQIANCLQRTPHAIEKRLKKLAMKPIYRTKKTPKTPEWYVK